MTLTTRFLKSCILLLSVSVAVCSADVPVWPTWRGPDMMGIADGTPPLTWSETENIKWKVRLEGDASNSTPVIWDDKLFFQIAVQTDTPAPPASAEGGRGRGRAPSHLYRFKVVCLDRNTGKTLWQTKVIEALPHEGHHADNGFASFSPVTDGSHLWASFGSRGVYCLTLDGRITWQRELPPMQMRGNFGEGNSPVLADGALVVVGDQQGDSYIIAFDRDTGDVLWRRDRDEASAWTSPIAVTVNGKTQIIVNGRNRIRAYAPASGDILWECDAGQTENVVPTPVVGHGMVFCTSGFRGAKLAAVALGRTGDLTGTDAVVWHVDEGTPYVPSPLLYGEKIYVLSGNNGVVSCYNAKTGSPYYTRQNMPEMRNIYSSPLGAAGRVYFVGRNGVTYVLCNAADTFTVLAVNTLDDQIDASPVVIDDILYLKGKKYIYAIAAKQ